MTDEEKDDCIVNVNLDSSRGAIDVKRRKAFTESFDGENTPLQNCRCTIIPVLSNGFDIKEYTLRFIITHQRLEACK